MVNYATLMLSGRLKHRGNVIIEIKLLRKQLRR